MVRHFLLIAIALSLASSCADAIAAPVNGPCTLAYSQSTPLPFWFPDGSHIDAVPVTAKLAVLDCPTMRPATSYQALVHGQDITYTVTWP